MKRSVAVDEHVEKEAKVVAGLNFWFRQSIFSDITARYVCSKVSVDTTARRRCAPLNPVNAT